MESMERTGDVYRECFQLIPHGKFSFAKILLLVAQFEIRQLNLKGARQNLGNAIGKAPKDKIFKKYIEIELQLGNIDRCRKLYEKYLEWAPENCYVWSKYAELERLLSETERARSIERLLSETERARSIFELAITQPALDVPELLWKAYIDFEISEGEYQRTRGLYERLLDRTKHLKVWTIYAKFGASIVEENDGGSELPQDGALENHHEEKKCIQHARRVFERAINYYKTSARELKAEHAMVMEDWLNMEQSFGELGNIILVQSKLPKKLKKRKQITSEDGGVAGYEEFIDYVFLEENQATNLKILEAANKWKKQKISSDESCRRIPVL